MTSSGMKIHVSIVGLASCLVLAACTPTRPSADLLGDAPRQLAQANTAGAQTYAPLELRFAEERLDQAHAAIAERKDSLALSLAQESALNSELAMVKSRLGKLREEVGQLKQQNAEIMAQLPLDQVFEENRP